MKKFVLLGAGGHAKALVEAIRGTGGSISAYVDPKPSGWLDAPQKIDEEDVSLSDGSIVVGLGGLSPKKLWARLDMLDKFMARGFSAEPIVHPSAFVSSSAILEPGTVILGKAIIQPDAKIGRGAIINTHATIEHDSNIGAGSHIAPGAIILGDTHIGDCTFVGAGAVILQGRSVPDSHFVAAQTCYTGDHE
jgi:sugar O-acyltransferase (sialic acid O-acetyltransferase NeuD family)